MATLTTKNLNEVVSESCKVLRASMTLLRESRLAIKDANLISNCADDFTKLFSLRIKHQERHGKEPRPVTGAPDLLTLADLLGRADLPAAIAEAKRVRALMKPILEDARAKLKAEA